MAAAAGVAAAAAAAVAAAGNDAMNLARIEAFLARLYSDAEAQVRFLADPKATAVAAGLSDAEAKAVADIDRTGFELACRSYAAKRAGAARPKRRWLARLMLR
jgi:hypothetical protein